MEACLDSLDVPFPSCIEDKPERERDELTFTMISMPQKPEATETADHSAVVQPKRRNVRRILIWRAVLSIAALSIVLAFYAFM